MQKVKSVLIEFCYNTKLYFKMSKKTQFKNLFKDWTLWQKLWLAVATIAISISSYLTWDPTHKSVSIIAFIASISGIWCVVLVAKGRISNYLWGVINIIFYAIASYNWQVYGDFMLNVFYYFPMQFWGWYIWTKPEFKTSNNLVKSRCLNWKNWLVLIIIVTLAVFFYGLFLTSINNVRPFVDSGLVVCSILAQFLMTKRYTEQWLLWIVVDILGVYIWGTVVFQKSGGANIGILIMYIAWLINAIYGYINWLKMSKEK